MRRKKKPEPPDENETAVKEIVKGITKAKSLADAGTSKTTAALVTIYDTVLPHIELVKHGNRMVALALPGLAAWYESLGRSVRQGDNPFGGAVAAVFDSEDKSRKSRF